MKHKWLYDFNVYDEYQDTVEEKKKDEDGEDITISRKVTKKRAVQFSILKPDRKLFESAELFYAVKLSEGIKAGLLTRPLLAKRYKNDGGAMSEPEKKRYAELYYDMLIKQEQMERLKLNLQDDGKDERHRLAGALMADIVQLREELTEYEMAQTTLFDQTAENRAKNQTIMWWVLHLAYKKDKGHEAVFDADSHEGKLDQYDALEEADDPFLVEVVKKFAYYVTFWYLNGITDKKDFEQVRTMYNRDNDVDEESLEKEIEEQNKPKEEPEKEDSKKEDSKKEDSKKEDSEKEASKKEASKEEPKAEEPKKKEPKRSQPKKKKPKKNKQEQKEAQVQNQEIENAT